MPIWWQRPGADTLIVMGVKAGSKAKANYGLTCSCQGPGCQGSLLWLCILHWGVCNAVEAGDRGQAAGHADAHMEGLVIGWHSGASHNRSKGLLWACKQLHGPWDQCTHRQPHSPPLSIHTAVEASDRGLAGNVQVHSWRGCLEVDSVVPASTKCDRDP